MELSFYHSTTADHGHQAWLRPFDCLQPLAMRPTAVERNLLDQFQGWRLDSGLYAGAIAAMWCADHNDVRLGG